MKWPLKLLCSPLALCYASAESESEAGFGVFRQVFVEPDPGTLRDTCILSQTRSSVYESVLCRSMTLPVSCKVARSLQLDHLDFLLTSPAFLISPSIFDDLLRHECRCSATERTASLSLDPCPKGFTAAMTRDVRWCNWQSCMCR